MTLCDQFCGTHIHFVDGRPYNDRDNKPHVCQRAQIAREFEGYYNMIQISKVRELLDRLQTDFNDLKIDVTSMGTILRSLTELLDWQQTQNKPLSEAFVKRKEAGRKRNYQ